MSWCGSKACQATPHDKPVASSHRHTPASGQRPACSTSSSRPQALEETLGKLTADFEEATSDKIKCQKEADATAYVIDLANRLVGGLASENVRWAESVAK